MFEIFANSTLLSLLPLSFIIGIFSVVIGGGFFFSIPLMQILFPGITFGQVVGNLKVGSFFRGIGSTWTTRKQIDWKEDLIFSLPLLLGAILGVSAISHLSQKWLLPAMIIAVLFGELAPRIAKHITNKHFYFASILTGTYAGFLGAGLGIILVSLFRLKHPEDEKIAYVKMQARFIEWLLLIIAVIMHFLHGNLIFTIWAVWSIGSLLGGIVGGKLLHKIGKMPGKYQKIVLRIAFTFAILVALWKFFI